MSRMWPKLAQLVVYRLGAQDAERINSARNNALAHREDLLNQSQGLIASEGNHYREGDEVAAVVVRVYGNPAQDEINIEFGIQCLLDGNDHLWVSSTRFGDKRMECRLP